MCSDGLDTIADCLRVSCRCPSGLRDFWQRRRLSGGLLQVPRRSVRLSGTVKDYLKVSCRYQDGFGAVTDCLSVSCWCRDGLRTVAVSLGYS
ncbi:hypothetical protein DPMN_093743 [Dreissena polymorpha]|uniref:Uncharacterized protein n=1 Tax=Dreissena polymorpha TaxID=45954 RepID=A0A9D4R207_DREPO|nr:hypothetical protein DPMN_093743 [Dreissena polymorpha]